MSKYKGYNGYRRGNIARFSRHGLQYQALEDERDCRTHVVTGVLRQLHLHEAITTQHNCVLVGNIKEDDEVLELFLFLKQISQWLGVHRGTFQGMEVTTFHRKNTLHMHG
jgi:hypothetical protein